MIATYGSWLNHYIGSANAFEEQVADELLAPQLINRECLWGETPLMTALRWDNKPKAKKVINYLVMNNADVPR